ncbi:dienelactone hydrolase family protein [Algoriphagus marinus]|uniref:dienelactone hydrolase family protein n=1 Tax=Algoriphagus marinus TaxID=1925762 RepID=UPI00094B8757|nr:dienelactone hydrolase family protein [Algoriphagus marinus]
MKTLLATFILLLTFNPLFAQTSLHEIGLSNGPYAVGFTHYTSHDSTRLYSRILDYTKEKIPRPITTSIWYPSEEKVNGLSPVTVKDYVRILAEEEEWEYLPDYYLLDWFRDLPNSPQNQQHLIEKSTAYFDLTWSDGSHPTVIYSPSYQASSVENFALCEYLASHGYVVISSPSRGADTRYLEGGTVKELETQARDIEFLIDKAIQIPSVNPKKIAAMGFSFGGLSNVLSQTRDNRIKAVVSLDGSIKYAYKTLQESLFFKIENANVPFIHMAQKDIPKEVLKSDNLDESLNNEFAFFEELSQNDAFQLKFLHMTHSYFSTFGLLFGNRDPRQDHADSLIMESYGIVAEYTLNFLNAYLQNQSEAIQYLNSSPEENKIGTGYLTIKRNEITKKASFDFSDFNDLTKADDYISINETYDSLKSIYPDLELPEGKLNYLGLQLLYNRETTPKSIRVFEFATQIYPTSANLFDSLGEAYLYQGDTSMSIVNYQKSLDLNPQNENAATVLKRLKGVNN